MRSTPILNVVRFLLLDRITYLVLPWAWAAFGFGLDAFIVELMPADHSHPQGVGGLAAAFIVVFALGVQSVARALPFGLTLGISRRTYFLGATALAVALGTGFGLVVAVGQRIERATGGWGINMAYFRVTGILDGSWWESWLTASTAFVLLFAYGMWYGLIFRRNGLAGTMLFTVVQGIVVALLAAIATWTHDWAQVGHFFANSGIAAILAMLAAVLLAGGLATVRRLAI